MPTELWFGDPQYSIKECVAVGHNQYAFNLGGVYKHSINVPVFMDLHFGLNWRALVIGQEGGIEYEAGSHDPIAVHPIWTYGRESITTLFEMVENPAGQDTDAINDPLVDPQWRPIAGQPHRVIIDGYPVVTTGPGRRFIALLAELQQEHPECVIDLHRPDGFRTPFGNDIGACDIDMHFLHFGSKIYLGNGRTCRAGARIPPGYVKWLGLVGFTVADMDDKSNRLIASMKSAIWAAQNFSSNVDFAARGTNTNDPTVAPQPATVMRQVIPDKGNKLSCDDCSLSTTCKYSREGSVCSVPGSEGSGLARTFRTRDSAVIIEKLGDLLDLDAKRLEVGLQNEAELGELDPQVTKIIGQMFEGGVKLAKLVDPRLAAAASHRVAVGIINNVPAAQVAAASPGQLVAGAIAALEAEGFHREDITQEHVARYLSQSQTAIEATAS